MESVRFGSQNGNPVGAKKTRHEKWRVFLALGLGHRLGVGVSTYLQT